jgi:hypothetical protein
MKTPNEIKDEVAKSHGWDNWILMATYKTHKELSVITNEAMEAYAQQFREVGDSEYWNKRCVLAEKCLEKSPCDPDITSEQIEALDNYHQFIRLNGNKEIPPLRD